MWVQWKQAKDTGAYKSAPIEAGGPAVEEVATIGSLMAFDGAAPELINGRLAMVGFLAALGAELSSGEGVFMQLNDAPGPVLVTFTLIAAATFVPLLQGMKPDAKQAGPFTAAAEMLNGRAAYAPALLPPIPLSYLRCLTVDAANVNMSRYISHPVCMPVFVCPKCAQSVPKVCPKCALFAVG